MNLKRRLQRAEEISMPRPASALSDERGYTLVGDVEPRTVDVHIRRLRKAVNGPGEEDVIRTVRSAGYALDSEPG